VGLRSLWHCLRSWAASEPSREGPYDRDEESLEAPLEADETERSQNQAIFLKESGVCRSLSVRSPRLLLDDPDLPEQIEKAVGQVLCSLGTRARVLDREHLLTVALRLNERAAGEKDQGRYQLAEALCQRALDVFAQIVDPDHPQLVEVLENNAGILRRLGRSQEADPLEARAATIRASRKEERFFRPLSPEADSRIQK
jgi:tetratricopeptide (TPR) repeat protein